MDKGIAAILLAFVLIFLLGMTAIPLLQYMTGV